MINLNSDYYKSLAQVLLKEGMIGVTKQFYGGWDTPRELSEIQKHANVTTTYWWNPPTLKGAKPECGEWIALTGIEEESAYEFQGTFVDSSEVYYVKAKLTCKCGQIDEEELIYDGTMSELIQLVVGEAPKVNYLA